VTFTLPEKTLTGELIEAVKNVSPYLVSVDLKGIYQQNYTFTFSYHNPSENLTAEDITPLRKKVVKLVEKQFGGKLIGKLE
jgi:phenylalanyl-tRNA synthetase beta subunit